MKAKFINPTVALMWDIMGQTKPQTDADSHSTASSSSLRLHDDMGIAKSQSHYVLCGDKAARKEASPNGVLKLDFARA